MPGILFGVVTDPTAGNLGDGAPANPALGRAADLIVSELHGKYFTHNYRGNIFYGSTSTTGVAIPIASTKTPVYTIWNPQGSGKLLVPIVTLITPVSAAAAVLGGFVWMATTNAGSTTGATAPIVSFTNPTTPISAFLGRERQKASVMNFGNDATTISITAAGTMYRHTGCATNATGTGATAAAQDLGAWIWRDEWDGTGVIPPNNAIHLMGNTAVAITVGISTAWAEISI